MDRGTFAEILAKYRAALEQYARWLTHDAAAAEDLLHDALEHALRRFDSFRQGTNAKAWLMTILLRVFYDDIKHAKVIDKYAQQLAVMDGADGDPLLSISDEQLHKAIAALPDAMRRLVELCYLKRMRRCDVAALLGIPPGTIATRLMRARKMLKDWLTRDE